MRTRRTTEQARIARKAIILGVTLLLGLALVTPPATAAPEVRLVKDIAPGEGWSQPSGLTDVGGTLYFVADDGMHGDELWRSDGTGAGTVMVKDIWPGWQGSIYPFHHPLTGVGGTLYFVASDGMHGDELWRSDGTEAGTVMVKDIVPGEGGSSYPTRDPTSSTGVGETLYFVASDGTHGYELWRSDGTEAGTVMVKDIWPGEERSYPDQLTDIGGTLYFEAGDGTHGRELWRSDGTEAGTVMVRDIWPGEGWFGWSDIFFLTDVGGTLFFGTSDGTHGYELWKSDGTESGTVMVRDIRPGEGSSGPLSLTDIGGTLYFGADDGTHGVELWRSDGTESGTVMVKDVRPGQDGSFGSHFLTYRLIDVGGTLLFVADDGTHGYELWRSDGTESGTVMVKDIRPGEGGSSAHKLTKVGALLYFEAKDGTHGRELWRSDGTEAGTVLVRDLNRGQKGSIPGSITDLGGTAFFTAQTPATGRELWAVLTTRIGTDRGGSLCGPVGGGRRGKGRKCEERSSWVRSCC
jgi:ELWxxDGT repeat protein